MRFSRNTIEEEFEEVELNEVFKIFDIQGAGEIGGAEFKAALRGMGFAATSVEVAALLNEFGKNLDDKINQNEFCNIMRGRIPSLSDSQEARRLFNLLDVDKSGSITLENLREVASSCACAEAFSEEELQLIIKEGSRSGESALTFDDFHAILREQGDISGWLSDD